MNQQHVSLVCLTHVLSIQDEILTVIRRVDENWAEGMLGDKIGIFPILYVEVNAQTLHSNAHPERRSRDVSRRHFIKKDVKAAANDSSQWFHKLRQMFGDRKEDLICPVSPFWSSGCYSVLLLCFSRFLWYPLCLNSQIYCTAFNGRVVVLLVSFLSLRLH